MAEYQMQEMTLADGSGSKVLYPRMRIWEQVTLEQMADSICYGSTYTLGDIVGLVRTLTVTMAKELAAGHSVKIDGLGVFTPSLGVRKDMEREEADGHKRNAMSIYVKGVNFRADKELVSKTADACELKRSPFKFGRSSQQYTAEERLTMARDYLEKYPFMKVADYCRLTGLLQSTATKELRELAHTEGSGIGVSGRGSHKVYVRRT